MLGEAWTYMILFRGKRGISLYCLKSKVNSHDTVNWQPYRTRLCWWLELFLCSQFSLFFSILFALTYLFCVFFSIKFLSFSLTHFFFFTVPLFNYLNFATLCVLQNIDATLFSTIIFSLYLFVWASISIYFHFSQSLSITILSSGLYFLQQIFTQFSELFVRKLWLFDWIRKYGRFLGKKRLVNSPLNQIRFLSRHFVFLHLWLLAENW